MKKLMMMAMMLVASATAFAGDSDALKAILKAKTYAEADALVKSSLANLANDAEKAKAYNKLVDLAYDAFMVQNTILTENEVNKQLGKDVKPVDENLMSEMAFNAMTAALECDNFDKKPNEKGKVAPKFDKKNAERLWSTARNQLVNAGQTAFSAQNYSEALKYWQLFVESDALPMFKDCNHELQKSYFGQVAYYAAICAFQEKNFDKSLELAEVAINDPEEKDRALSLKLEILGNKLSTKEDSINYCNKLKDIYAEHQIDGVMEKLFNTLLGLGQKDEAFKVLDDALAVNPNNFVALADKGMNLINDNPAEACACLKKAFEIKSDMPLIAAYAGTALSNLAQNTEDEAQKKALFKEAISYLDKAKELDPDMLQAKWGYFRYNAYYNYYGEDAPETKQAEAESH